MPDLDLISACVKNDGNAQRAFYERFFSLLSNIATRYAKNKEQAQEIVQNGFAHLLSELHKYKPSSKQNLDEWVNEEFIKFTVEFIRSIRNEYYVASTVRVTDTTTKSYDLFVDNVLTDFKNVDYDVLIASLQQLVPSQRLIFNLHIVEEYDLKKAADILEASEQTVKSNLEKARYNLQKNIDKNYKSLKNEQPI
jgi:RNA polymerase sigma-70 factor (ECF subfamily)